MNHVLHLAEIRPKHRRFVGGKGFALAVLSQHGITVPATLIVTTRGYENFVAVTGLRGRILLELRRKNFQDLRWEEMWDASLRLRHLFLNTPMPDDLAASLGNALAPHLPERCVVRSSAPGEDSRQASFAGLHASFVNVVGLDAVFDHIKLVWASLWSDAALRYRRGLVGESGSGKTTLAMTILRYLGESGVIRQGKIELFGENLLAVETARMREIWGRKITFVPQNPLSSLNPSLRIWEQLAEILRVQLGMDAASAHQKTIQRLQQVRLPDPQRVAASYPHQISGGMQQRVLIAMALCTEPELLVLDEPTTNLDVTTQAAILELFRELIHGRQTAVLYVTHNLGVVALLCDRVAVLYAGELVEDAVLGQLEQFGLHGLPVRLLV